MDRDMFEDNKLVYIPAILPSPGLYDKFKLKGKHPHFWNSESSIWYYKNLLVSTYHAKDIKEFRKELSISPEVKVFGDSGGFQAVTLGGYISAKEVIKWQKANCDAGLILDKPPYHFGGGAQMAGTPTKEFFDECLNETIVNANTALDQNVGENKIRLYGVVQGDNWGQINDWYNKIVQVETNDRKFDAWAMSPKPSLDPYKVGMFGILLMEKGLSTPIHMLQISGKAGIVVSSYIQHLTKLPITIDSSTFSVTSRYGTAVDPMDVPNLVPVGDKISKEGKSGWWCECPICTNIGINYNTWSPEYISYMNIHNLYQICKLVKYLGTIVQNEEWFFDVARKIAPQAYEVIQILRFYKKHGLDAAISTYPKMFQTGYKEETKSLFNL